MGHQIDIANEEAAMDALHESRQSNRKIHNSESGYIAERKNPYFAPKDAPKVVIYVAKEQGIDVGLNKYAVVCDAHGTICGATNIPDARTLMKSVEFCEECMKLADNS